MADEKKLKEGDGWWGFVLIAAGAVLLLHNLGYIGWNWYTLWQAWPVLLVVWGIGMLDMDERLKRIIIFIMIAATLVWVMGGFGSPFYRMTPQDRMMMRFPDERQYWR